jgi:signal transduction histidine kinase
VTGLDRGLHAGLAALRLAAWAWLAVVTASEHERLSRPGLAIALVGVTLAWSLLAALERRPLPVVDLVVGVALLAADRHVYDGAHPQGFGGAWPLAGAIAAGLAWGPIGGAAGGLALGAARWAGTADAAGISVASSAVLYVMAGGVAGFVVARLRRAESEVAEARARERVARTLHDGVLQTLAVVQRRSSDADLARLAREQERELRSFLFGVTTPNTTDLAAALRTVAGRIEDRHGLRADVVVVEAVADLPPAIVEALAGAVGEALTNAAKHGGADRATIYVDVEDDEVFVSVKENGAGFDPATTGEGVGISASIRGRIADVDGRVELGGTEVRLWVPRP